ncbi:MAG: ABC transporter ATP-binding protein [Ignavibacteriales bacterium]|nr:ABC transporter ATP-binding protein [Ignavibacteriales bacterium]
MTKKPALVRGENIWKEYHTGEKIVLQVLKGIDIEIREGEITVIVGPSGSGKSTLLHLLGGLDRPTEGKVFFDEKDIFAFSEEELAAFRNRTLGFVFQFHHLLPEFTALENVCMPALIGGKARKSAFTKAEKVLFEVGLDGRLENKPNQLSGGEQQRVAVARALMNDPQIVLADEPSGNLDEESGLNLHKLLVSLSEKRGLTFVIATHNPDLAKRAHRVLRLTDGRLQGGRTP